MPRVDYVGFDTEPRYIEYAREHYRDRGRFFCEHFAQAHVTKFKPFDAIMLLGIVHHINDAEAEDLFGLLGEMLGAKRARRHTRSVRNPHAVPRRPLGCPG